MLADIIESGTVDREKSLCVNTRVAGATEKRYKEKAMHQMVIEMITDGAYYRKLTPIECERLMGLPDNYTNHVSNTQRYKMLGNGWEVNTITHIINQSNELSFI